MTTAYKKTSVDGLNIFYREAGNSKNPTIFLLHGFPSSSHMFRDLIPQLATEYHVIAPDYPGFGYSDAPDVDTFTYTFAKLTEIIEKFINAQGINQYSLFMQDYGGPIGFRIAAKYPERIESLIIQNANAYVEGISAAFEPMQPFWANRNAETETPVRAMLTRETTIFQYTHGASNVSKVSPDAWSHDQSLLDRPGNDQIQLALLHNYTSNVALYSEWQEYFRTHQPATLIVSGKNDPFFLPAGQEAFKRDLPHADVNFYDGGHFVLEEFHAEIATKIRAFLSVRLAKAV
ncbi:MAG: alpha/beta hydrolase [Rickettsiales bacterium]|nr:alpha/beta hydrolase [Rickettsiales bacterium]